MIIKPIALAGLLAAAQLANVAYAQAPKGAPAAAVQPASPATPAALQLKAPEDWIIYDNTTTYTPVLDDLSRHLDAARKAFDAKDNKKAATEMRAAADELKKQAARADKESKELVAADQALLAADQKFTQDAVARINASATKVSSAASAIESGKITKKSDPVSYTHLDVYKRQKQCVMVLTSNLIEVLMIFQVPSPFRPLPPFPCRCLLYTSRCV